MPDGSWLEGKAPGGQPHRKRAAGRQWPDPLPPDPELAVFAGAVGGRGKAVDRQPPVMREREHHAHRDDLARQLGGAIEKPVGFGRADVITDTGVFEVEPYRTWQAGIQQAVAYAAALKHQRPALAVYGVIRREELLALYLRIRSTPLDGLRTVTTAELWWWTGTTWDHIRSRSSCVNMPHGSRFSRCRHCGDSLVSVDGAYFGRDDASSDRAWYDYPLQAGQAHLHHCLGFCAAAHQDDPYCGWQLLL